MDDAIEFLDRLGGVGLGASVDPGSRTTFGVPLLVVVFEKFVLISLGLLRREPRAERP